MKQQSSEPTRHRIAGRFWSVDFEKVGDATLPQYDPMLATLTQSPKGANSLLRIYRSPPDANLNWPLPLRYEEQIHCSGGVESRIYLVDGWLSSCSGDRGAEVHVGAPPGDAFKGIVAAGLLYRLSQNGVLSLHASALVGQCGAVLTLGASGSGKSALSAAWMHFGQVVSDDHVLVSPGIGDASGPWVEPFRADMYLRQDGVALLPECAQAFAEYGCVKTRLPRAEAREYFCECAPVAALVILDSAHRGTTSALHPLSQADACLALIAANSHLSAGPALAAPSLWSAAIELACCVPIFRLSVGADLLRRPEREARSISDLIHCHLRRTPRNDQEGH